MLKSLTRLFRRRQDQAPSWIDIDALHRRMTAGAGMLLIDVRGADEFNAPPGHLPTAINIPLQDLSARITEVATHGQTIVLVCKTDRRSAAAAAALRADGFRDVAVLRGGTDGWHRRGLPLD